MTVEVYEWLQFGVVVGCGTRVERDHWEREGVLCGVELGRVIAVEPATENARRLEAWSRA